MCGNLLCVALLSIIAAVHTQNNMTTTMVPTTTSTTTTTTTTASTTMVPTTTPMQPLNCTNVPEVPIKPLDRNITHVLALANENIRVCNLIIPFLNSFNAKLKLQGVCKQINQIMKLIKYLQIRIAIINRRLDCGLPNSVKEARNLKQMLRDDQLSKRVLYGAKIRLTDIKTRLGNIYKK